MTVSENLNTLAVRPKQALTDSKLQINWYVVIVVSILAHVGFGVAVHYVPSLATYHAYAALLMALVLAISQAPLWVVAAALAYISASEVLWRMNDARVFWESGKYAVALFGTLALLRSKQTKIPILAFLYIMLLVPSSFMTLGNFDWNILSARSTLSFNLSGPVALFASAWFFHNIYVSRQQLRAILMVIAMPVLVLATKLAIVVTTTDITWHGDSNGVASGGYGANQVSATLGMGIACLLIVLILMELRWTPRIVLIALVAWFSTQAMLTFSRGGIVNGFVPVIIGVTYLLLSRDRAAIIRITPIVAGTVIFIMFAFPALNAFTDGMLIGRFTNFDATGREDIANVEYEVFQDNVIFGVGPGMAKKFTNMAAHTEYSRLLAEHGLFGMLAMGVLGLMAAANFFRNTQNPTVAALVLILVVWSFVFMSHSAMRIAATSFFFGMSFLNFDFEQEIVEE